MTDKEVVTTNNETEFLKTYDDSEYEKPSVTADINIFTVGDAKQENYRKLSEKRLKILLVKRGEPPYEGAYALPGGFLKPTETLEEAARRELREETGVDCDFLEQLHTVSTLKRDPRTWVLTTAFLALVDEKKNPIVGGSDAKDAEWFEVSLEKTTDGQDTIDWKLVLQKEGVKLHAMVRQKMDPRYMDEFPHLELIENKGLAFDHAWIITYSLLTLRRLVRSTNTHIVFELLPEEFTLSEIQQVWETILGETYPAAAFRRKIAGLVEETDRQSEGAGHRPSKLYRRKHTFN